MTQPTAIHSVFTPPVERTPAERQLSRDFQALMSAMGGSSYSPPTSPQPVPPPDPKGAALMETGARWPVAYARDGLSGWQDYANIATRRQDV